ncbi:DUF2079 domain-containing protein [Streptomyces sp. NBC_00091]|uniref:DUF2079 domain-containing protein n=1 Tax=Streptomyces sp. NBC_00091 TaxID=2975648 RepID=UPI00224E2E62|nr:DUF2079 domain-containing protein [Streptomyces sp. NBC_00091]MCX5377945.1 DUF2079 domain-containing protein [Streptomyces sp. NBC_00091]
MSLSGSPPSAGRPEGDAPYDAPYDAPRDAPYDAPVVAARIDRGVWGGGTGIGSLRGGPGPAGRAARAAHWAPYALASALFLAYAVLSVSRFRRLEESSWDLGIFEQAVRAYAWLQPPLVDIKGPGFNILGDHFSPVIALIAPLYRVFPGPVTLLVVQAALFALSALPVTRASVRLLGQARGLALGAAYGLSWGIQKAVDFDFHEICFAVPLLAFALEALLARRWRAALGWGLPLLLVKEDLGVTLAALALVVAWRARRADRRAARIAVAVAVAGAAAAALVFTVVIPAFATDGYAYWEKISEPGGPLRGLGTKLTTLGWVLVPTTGLLALRSPLLLVAAPTLGWRFVSGDAHYWSTDWHYSAVLMPVVALALADALDTARRSSRPRVRAYAVQLPGAVLAAALTLSATGMPLARLGERATYEKPGRAVAVERLLAQIPDGVRVEAGTGPLTRLTSRCQVFWIGNTKGVLPAFLVFDNSSGWAGDPVAYAGQLHPGSRFVVAGEAGGFVLLQRVL